MQALEHAAAEDLLDESRVEVRELQAPSTCTWGWKLAAYEPNVWIEITRPGVTSRRSRIARNEGISIAATQLGGRAGVVPKHVTTSQQRKTPRADASPRF